MVKNLQCSIISPSLIQNRYFLTEDAFEECISVCASGQNPSGLKFKGPYPGTCVDNDGCLENAWCEMDLSPGEGDWGFCIPCSVPGLRCGWFDGLPSENCDDRCGGIP